MSHSSFTIHHSLFIIKKRFFFLWLINFFLATIVLVILHTQSNLLFLNSLTEKTQDWLMYWRSYLEPVFSYQSQSLPLSLFTIDDKTHREWGSPLLTPRDKLKQLIEQARQGGANVIAINLDLARLSNGCFPEPGKISTCPTTQLQADVKLGLYLQQLNEEFHDPQNYDTPIILLEQAYRPPLDDNGFLQTGRFLEKPYSFFAAYLKEEKNVFWTSTFILADEDRIRRRWALVSLACENHHLTVVPSLPLLAAMAQRYSCEDSTRNAAYMIRDWKRRLNNWANPLPCDPSLGTTIWQICQRQPCPDLTIKLPSKKGVTEQNHIIDLTQNHGFEMINYRFAPFDNNQENGQKSHLFNQYSALDVLAHGVSVTQQIVLIGATHQENYDIYPIPIRFHEVNHLYSIANAIDTIQHFGQFKPQSFIYQLIILLILTLIITAVFNYYSLFSAWLLTTSLMVILLLIESVLMNYRFGITIIFSVIIIQLNSWYLMSQRH
jgi:CHASE2 domain-containing sensor protein